MLTEDLGDHFLLIRIQVRLDGWCEGGLGQPRNDAGGCMKDRKEWRALVHT